MRVTASVIDACRWSSNKAAMIGMKRNLCKGHVNMVNQRLSTLAVVETIVKKTVNSHGLPWSAAAGMPPLSDVCDHEVSWFATPVMRYSHNERAAGYDASVPSTVPHREGRRVVQERCARKWTPSQATQEVEVWESCWGSLFLRTSSQPGPN